MIHSWYTTVRYETQGGALNSASFTIHAAMSTTALREAEQRVLNDKRRRARRVYTSDAQRTITAGEIAR